MDVGRHPNIELLAYSDVEKVEGELGDFRVTIRRKARYVDESKCTGCGACAEKCPTTMTDEYNLGFAKAKAIFRYFAQGIPSAYTINADHCRQLQGKKCGVCAKVCQAGAVDYKQVDRTVEVQAGAIIVATGYDLFDATRMPEYGYGRIRNVVTALEFERFLSASGPTHGHVYRPSDLDLKERLPELEKQQQKAGKALEALEKKFEQSSDAFYPRYQAGELPGQEYDDWAKQIDAHRQLTAKVEALRAQVEQIHSATRLAFVQCVGSRDIRFNRQCSSFCCMHAIKEAIIAHEHETETKVTVFGMDIRAVGKGFEEYRNRGAREAHIEYIRSRVAEITEAPDASPVLWYEDTKRRETVQVPVDVVILATACEPSNGTRQLAETVGIETNEFGFIKTDPFQPLDTTRAGVFVCGCAHGPQDIPESVAQASSTAARVAQMLSADMRKAATA
jgi:heterodisulfide reductase subunit A-like polyferredoxin